MEAFMEADGSCSIYFLHGSFHLFPLKHPSASVEVDLLPSTSSIEALLFPSTFIHRGFQLLTSQFHQHPWKLPPTSTEEVDLLPAYLEVGQLPWK